MNYLMSSVKQAAEAVGIWTGDNWDVKRFNLLYTMVSVYKEVLYHRRIERGTRAGLARAK